MRIFNVISLCVFLFLISGTLSAQPIKVSKKITEQIEEINTVLTTAGQALALTQEQKDKIVILYQKRNENIKALDTASLTEEDKQVKIKEIRKNVNIEVNNNILTKEQKKVRNTVKKD
jgi:S-adenosylmethionine synthetase